MHKAIIFCPLTCLRRYIIKKQFRESHKLQDCFQFEEEVKPGWIQYNPNEITVISCNDSLRPLVQCDDILDLNKQMVTVKNESDLLKFKSMLDKPVLMCVTRRQNCPNIAQTDGSSSVTENLSLNLLERELRSMNGFDIDFAVIFPPGVLRELLDKILRNVSEKITARSKYCFMIDIKQMMKELTPPEVQDPDSLEYVSWHNTAFWLTNHCKPNHSLMYVNGLLFWTVLFPFSFFVALPYRAVRKMLCKDSHVNIKTALTFVAESKDTVAVFVWFTERPPPGSYKKHANYFSLRAAKVSDLKPFFQDCNIVSFDFGNK